MSEDTEKVAASADELHEEVYGKPDTAPNAPYVDDDGIEDEYQSPPPPAQSAPAAPEDFKHKYDVLQGKYNAEIGRMNKMLSDTMLEKERLAAQFGSQNNPSTAPANPFSDSMESSDQQIEFLKAQYPDAYPGIEALIAKKAFEVLRPVTENVNRATAEIKGERYMRDLDNKMSNWRDINNDPDFAAWLNTPDRYTGTTKHALLKDAYNQGDSVRTLAFFEDYVNTRQSQHPPSQSPQSPPPRQYADTSTYPSTSGSPAPSTSEKGIVNRSDIDRFYKDRAQGRFIGTEEDVARIESRFFRAIKEGKVR